jgi:hypothetical protein
MLIRYPHLGLGIAISAELQSRNSGLNSLLQSGAQADGIFKPLKVPEYFSEFKEKPEYLGFLGGCIVAKLVFNDASSTKLWMSKVMSLDFLTVPKPSGIYFPQKDRMLIFFSQSNVSLLSLITTKRDHTYHAN